MRSPLLVLSCLVALVAVGCHRTPAPDEVVRSFHDHAVAGKWDQALALVDLDTKCRELLGDIYVEAPAADQATMRDFWGRKLKEGTQTFLSRHFGDSAGTLSVTSQTEQSAEVEQTKGKFTLIYALEKRDDGWIIVDRTHELDGHRPNLKSSLNVVIQRITGDLGHKPSLAELNEHLESYMGRLRIRRFKVDTSRPLQPRAHSESPAATD